MKRRHLASIHHWALPESGLRVRSAHVHSVSFVQCNGTPKETWARQGKARSERRFRVQECLKVGFLALVVESLIAFIVFRLTVYFIFSSLWFSTTTSSFHFSSFSCSSFSITNYSNLFSIFSFLQRQILRRFVNFVVFLVFYFFLHSFLPRLPPKPCFLASACLFSSFSSKFFSSSSFSKLFFLLFSVISVYCLTLLPPPPLPLPLPTTTILHAPLSLR